MYVIPDTQYTLNASAKTITLAATYATLSAGQITKIKDITTEEILYDSERVSFTGPQISVATGVITYTQGNKVANTDKLRIVVDANYSDIYHYHLDGGSA